MWQEEVTQTVPDGVVGEPAPARRRPARAPAGSPGAALSKVRLALTLP